MQPQKRSNRIADGELSSDDVIVVLMGPTGSGKSSFIEKATGEEGIAGHGLQSYTNEISVFKLPYSQNRNICFVDTPGFDDTNKSDRDIFKQISRWLNKRKGARLSGLLYFHRISDNRMAGTSLNNFKLFERLCGNDFTKIVLTTTMWGEVDELDGTKRERELKRDYWRPMIERGSPIQRFLYSRESALEILLPLFDDAHRRSARAILLQNEITDRGFLLKDTSAGQTLKMGLGDLIARHQDVLENIRRELADSASDSDQLRLLMEEYQRASMQLQCAREDMRKMDSSIGDGIRRLVGSFNWGARNAKEKETSTEQLARQAVQRWLRKEMERSRNFYYNRQ